MQERDWQASVSAFVGKPENAAFRGGGALAPMMREALQARFAQPVVGKSYAQVLDECADDVRAQLRGALGLDATKAAKAPVATDELKARREKRLASAVVTPTRGKAVGEPSNPWEGWAARD